MHARFTHLLRHFLPESVFDGWRIDHDLTGTWRAECPDWGVTVVRKTFIGMVSAMARAKPRGEK